MPFILMKNNLKLMLRSKWILFVMIVLPVITIALLSNAFKEMMNTDYSIDAFNAGYRIDADHKYSEALPDLVEGCKEQGITLLEYPQGDITALLQGSSVAVFVDIKDDSYTVYKSNKKEREAAVIESIFSEFFYRLGVTMTAHQYAGAGGNGVISEQSGGIIEVVLETDPVPSSTDYYGIIYIVYFAWCGMVSLVAVISSERKSAIPKRLRVAHMNKLGYYIGKFLPCALAVFIEVCTAWLLSVLIFDIHWGKPVLSALIILLISLAASAVGMVLFQLFRNVAISIVVGFIVTWIAGFFGGSFEAYLYLRVPSVLIHSTPMYYINRTLVEYSTMGYSDYAGKCFLFLIAIIVVFSLVGILLMNRKMEE